MLRSFKEWVYIHTNKRKKSLNLINIPHLRTRLLYQTKPESERTMVIKCINYRKSENVIC